MPSQHKTSTLSRQRWALVAQADVLMFACVSHIFPLGLFVCLSLKHSHFPADRARMEPRGGLTDWDHTRILSYWNQMFIETASREVALHAVDSVWLHITTLQCINSVTHCLYDVGLFAERKCSNVHFFLLVFW